MDHTSYIWMIYKSFLKTFFAKLNLFPDWVTSYKRMNSHRGNVCVFCAVTSTGIYIVIVWVCVGSDLIHVLLYLHYIVHKFYTAYIHVPVKLQSHFTILGTPTMYLHKVINIYTHMLGGPNTWLCVGRLCAYKLYGLLCWLLH